MKFAERFIKWCPEPPKDCRSFGSRGMKTLARKIRSALMQNAGWKLKIALFVVFWIGFSVYPQHCGPHDPLWYPLNYGMWAIVVYFSYLSYRWFYRIAREKIFRNSLVATLFFLMVPLMLPLPLALKLLLFLFCMFILREKTGWCPLPPDSNDGLKKVLKARQMTAMTSLRTTGILMIASILLCSLIALFGLARFESYGWDRLQALSTWSFSLITVGFSSAGALLTFKRKEVTLAVVSTILMMVSAVSSLFMDSGWVLGTPTLMIATFSLAYYKFSNNG